MAHDIQQMVYAGATPWHGLGTQLPRNGTWDDIRQAAGFYTALQRPLYLEGRSEPVPDRKALIRDDTGQYLATVSDGYEVVQFEELAKAGVIASGNVDAIWHTAGTLGKVGARGWLLAELPGVLTVRGDRSEIRKYVLLTTAHDGLSAAILKNCATRVVCRNTLGTALGEDDGAVWRVRHTRNANHRLESAAKAFRAMATHFEEFGQLANAMAGLRFTEQQHERTLREVLPIPADNKPHLAIKQQRARVAELFETFDGSDGIRGTAWGAFQAWTQWADHDRPMLGAVGRDRLARSFERSVLGSSARLKAKALASILEVAKVPMAAEAA